MMSSPTYYSQSKNKKSQLLPLKKHFTYPDPKAGAGWIEGSSGLAQGRAAESFCVSPGGRRALRWLQLSEIQKPDSGTGGGIRGRSGRPGSFVSPWGRIGRL